MRATWLVLTLLVEACTYDATPTGDLLSSSVEDRDIPLAVNAQVDVLFIVDDSPAMTGYRDHLAQSAAPIVQMIEGGPRQPDLHFGVVTGDLSDGGRLRDGRELIDEARWNWQRYRNYDGTLPDNVASLFDAGDRGATEQALFATALRALDPATNPGFLRTDAYLAIVFVTANDDASGEDVAAVATALKSVKSDSTKILVSAVGGANSPRLLALLDQFPNRSTHVSIDDYDMTGVVALVPQLFKFTLGAPCLEGRLVEPHQVNAWLENPATGEQVVFRECAAVGDRRCWSLVHEPINCATSPGNWMIRLDQADFVVPTHARFQLLTELHDRAD